VVVVVVSIVASRCDDDTCYHHHRCHVALSVLGDVPAVAWTAVIFIIICIHIPSLSIYHYCIHCFVLTYLSSYSIYASVGYVHLAGSTSISISFAGQRSDFRSHRSTSSHLETLMMLIEPRFTLQATDGRT
jgi:hypothetical protein